MWPSQLSMKGTTMGWGLCILSFPSPRMVSFSGFISPKVKLYVCTWENSARWNTSSWLGIPSPE